MIIRDLYIKGIPFSPFKADPPLIIDADAVLPRPISGKLFQPVRRRDSQIVERYGVIQHSQLAQSNLLNVRWQSARKTPTKDPFCFNILEGLNHKFII